jgi:hypothetical protein
VAFVQEDKPVTAKSVLSARPLEDGLPSQIFKAPRLWASNVWGATVAGIGGGLLISVVAGILVFDSAGQNGRLVGLALLVTVSLTFLAAFPGNLVAAVPFSVDLLERRGLVLHAPLKELYIPLGDVSEVRDSAASQVFQQGIVVRFNKRHGLIKSFVIHWAYGDEGRALARAIREEILRKDE